MHHDEVTRDHDPLAPIQEIDFAQLRDGSLVETIENPDNPLDTCLAVCKGNEVKFTTQIESDGMFFRALRRNGGYLRDIPLPNGADSYESVRSLLNKIHGFLGRCLDVGDYEKILLTAYIVATWFIERLPVTPYLALVGLPGSGKSTVLQVLRLLCRRSLLTADISSAAFYQACDQLTPTLLVDETATAGCRKTLFHLLRTGASRGTVAPRKNQSCNAFGAKVVAWERLPDDRALNSRCVIISLNESRRTDLARPTDPHIVAEAQVLQRQLLRYRLENLNTVVLSPTPGDEKLISRHRDLFQAFALASEPWRRILARIFTEQQALTREPLYPPYAAVLYQLYGTIHAGMDASREYDTVQRLADLVNRGLELTGNPMRLNPKQVGAALTALGISGRHRSAQGWRVVLTEADKKRIHDLVEMYGLENDAFFLSAEKRRECAFCKGLLQPL